MVFDKPPIILNKKALCLLITTGLSSKLQGCGAGGIRTLVQTSSKVGFYMLSFCLIVGSELARSGPIQTVFPFFSPEQRNEAQAISTFAMPYPEHR